MSSASSYFVVDVILRILKIKLATCEVWKPQNAWIMDMLMKFPFRENNPRLYRSIHSLYPYGKNFQGRKSSAGKGGIFLLINNRFFVQAFFDRFFVRKQIPFDATGNRCLQAHKNNVGWSYKLVLTIYYKDIMPLRHRLVFKEFLDFFYCIFNSI